MTRAGYVLALKPSHAWWHEEGEIGSPFEAAAVAGEAWEGERHPGEWAKVPRRFRDGHEETWWALKVDVGPYGPQRVSHLPTSEDGLELTPPARSLTRSSTS
jgi:hypothetical protein